CIVCYVWPGWQNYCLWGQRQEGQAVEHAIRQADEEVSERLNGRTFTVYSGVRCGIRWRYNGQAAAGMYTATGNPMTVSGTQAVSHGAETLPTFITTVSCVPSLGESTSTSSPRNANPTSGRERLPSRHPQYRATRRLGRRPRRGWL